MSSEFIFRGILILRFLETDRKTEKFSFREIVVKLKKTSVAKEYLVNFNDFSESQHPEFSRLLGRLYTLLCDEKSLMADKSFQDKLCKRSSLIRKRRNHYFLRHYEMQRTFQFFSHWKKSSWIFGIVLVQFCKSQRGVRMKLSEEFHRQLTYTTPPNSSLKCLEFYTVIYQLFLIDFIISLYLQ